MALMEEMIFHSFIERLRTMQLRTTPATPMAALRSQAFWRGWSLCGLCWDMSRLFKDEPIYRVTFISKKRGKQNSIFLILSVYCTQIVSFLWLWCLVLTKYLHLDKWHKISLKKTMISQENYFLLIKILSYWRFCPNYFLIFDHFWSFWHYAWKIWTNWQSCCL